MMATLALLSALSAVPAQEGQLQFTNVRPTFCMWGGARPGEKYLPGDVYFLSFDIENLMADKNKNGKVSYRMGMEVLDKNDKQKFKSDPEKSDLVSSLGGTKLPAYVFAPLGTDTQPGDYTVKVTLEDLVAKKKIELVKKFEVTAREFGIVRMNTSFDFEAKIPAPSMAVPGQAIWINFAITGFKRDEKTKQPKIALEWRILDENGKPTLDKPVPGEIPGKDDKIEESWSLVPTSFPLNLNRAGKFTLELKAVDKLAADKTATLKFPITVVDNK